MKTNQKKKKVEGKNYFFLFQRERKLLIKKLSFCLLKILQNTILNSFEKLSIKKGKGNIPAKVWPTYVVEGIVLQVKIYVKHEDLVLHWKSLMIVMRLRTLVRVSVNRNRNSVGIADKIGDAAAAGGGDLRMMLDQNWVVVVAMMTMLLMKALKTHFVDYWPHLTTNHCCKTSFRFFQTFLH